jgi:prolyl-tRNA synthetase
MTTRMIGTLIMTHADDDGLVLPPRIAPTHVVIIPITPKEETRAAVLDAADKLAAQLRSVRYFDAPVEVEVDRRDLGGGVKNWEWIKKGVPLRVELGPRDLESGKVAVSRRDQPVKSKEFLSAEAFVAQAAGILDSIQNNLLQRATAFRDANTKAIDSKDEFYAFFTAKDSTKPEIHGGFALTHWDGSRAVEEQIKRDLKVTIRCIPFDDPANPPEAGTCPFTGNPSARRVVWAKAY